MGQALRVQLWQKGLAERARRDKAKSIEAVLARLEQDRLARVQDAKVEQEMRFKAASSGLPFPLTSRG